MVILATEGLTKNFGGLRATDSLSLAIQEGKLTSVIGPNGAGKTTLFNLITGMIRPDAGRVVFRGTDITHLPVYQIVRRGISRSFQIINLFNELPLYENVWLGVQAQQGHGPEVLTSANTLSAVKDETDRIIQEIGLAGKERVPVKGLSYGDRRVLEITVALTAKPSLLLLDEPFAGLDPISLNVVATLIRKLNDALGLTSIIVTYDVSESLKVVDYIYVIADGKVMGEGAPDAVLSSTDPYLQQFVINADGSEPVNLTNTPKEHEHYPQVSPDGTKICFSVDEGEGREGDDPGHDTECGAPLGHAASGSCHCSSLGT